MKRLGIGILSFLLALAAVFAAYSTATMAFAIYMHFTGEPEWIQNGKSETANVVVKVLFALVLILIGCAYFWINSRLTRRFGVGRK